MNIEQFSFGHCPSGKGFDPTKSSGYQIRARSAGAVPYVEALSAIGTHLGALVHEAEEPQAAERKWEETTQNRDAVPENILKRFPVIWEYQLIEGNAALTRGVYLGLTRDAAKRTGNYVTHSLIFAPELLLNHAGNPLALMNSPAFPPQPDSVKQGELPTLPDLGRDTQAGCDTQILASEPYAARLPVLLSSMMQSVDRTHPIVIVLPEWTQGPRLMGALLQLVPRALRCKLSFITYETDPKWRKSRQNNVGDASLAEHSVTVICPRGKSDPTPKPGSLQGVTLFNFITGEHAVRSSTAYADFAAGCLARNELPLLDHHHHLAAGLRCDRSADACDAIVAVVDPSQALQDNDAELLRQLGIVLPLVNSATAAAAGFEQVKPFLEKMVADHAAISGPCAEAVAKLLKHCPEEEPNAAPISTVAQWFQQAIAEGRPTLAIQWLDCAGTWRQKALLSGISSAIGISVAGEPAECEALAQILAEGICALAKQKSSQQPPAIEECITAFFKVLPSVDRAMNLTLWDRVSQIVDGYFAENLSADRKMLLYECFKAISPDTSPDAVVSLGKRVIQSAKPGRDELLKDCEILVRACHHCRDSKNVAQWTMGEIEAEFTSPPELGLALARLAEKSWSGPVEDVFYRRYVEHLGSFAQSKPANGRDILENQLLNSGLYHVICRRFLDRVEAWPNSEKQIEDCLSQPLFAGMPDVLCEVAAYQVRNGVLPDGVNGLAAWLIKRRPGNNPMGPGWVTLYSAVAAGVKASPLAPEWRSVLLPIPDAVDKHTCRRIQFLAFLGDTALASQSLNWSFERFDFGNAAWIDYLKDLDPHRRENVVGDILDCFNRTGLSSSGDAAAFLNVLQSVGEFPPDKIVAWLYSKMRDRDTASQLIVILAFFQLGLAKKELTDFCGEMVRGLARECASCRPLIEAYLKRRFAPDTPEYRDRLDQLCSIAGLRQADRPETGPKSEGFFGKINPFGKKG